MQLFEFVPGCASRSSMLTSEAHVTIGGDADGGGDGVGDDGADDDACIRP